MLRILTVFSLLVLLFQCSSNSTFPQDKSLIYSEYNKGMFSSASMLIEKSLKTPGLGKDQKEWLMIRQAMIDRTRLDFSKSEEQVKSQLQKYFKTIPDTLLKSWESTGHLEMRRIDGVKRYFNYAVSNLFRLDTVAAKIRQDQIGIQKDPLDSICIENTREIVVNGKPGATAATRTITIEYSISVDADVVPPGEELSCWMPFPKESLPRQQNVKLLSSIPQDARRSAQRNAHSSLFAVKKAIAGIPTIFSYTATFDISGQWFESKNFDPVRSVEISDKPDQYTNEELPHLAFTPSVKHLADSLSAGESDPFILLKRFYYWIDQNIPWASALEYSTFECIPDYVLSQRHGDCGMKTFLLMSLARYKGIPARWQSGWMLHPGEENLHDWCELWFPSTGWIPVDMSFGLQNTEDPILKEFYMTGIDSYRMIVNDGFAQEFDPPKNYFRSEPFDFQRGEVEWAKGNLYFNQWDYNLKVLSIEKKN
jgi:transglutaminase-like putative cysteine protease